MNKEIEQQMEQLFSIKDFPVTCESLKAVHTVKSCIGEFDNLPIYENGKPIVYDINSDIGMLYVLRQYLLGKLNASNDQPVVNIELKQLHWVASKYKEFCDKLPADLQLDLLKSLNGTMYAVYATPMSHLVQIHIESGYENKQKVSGFKFYLDDIGEPIPEEYVLRDIHYMHTKDFLCSGDLTTQRATYSDMTQKFYKITRELLLKGASYPTIRNTLFWEEGGREVAFVINEVDIHYHIIREPLIENVKFSYPAIANYKDAFSWLNSFIFMKPNEGDKCCKFDSDMVNAFLFRDLPLGENIYEISDFYSVGAMQQREVFYSDVSNKVDVKEAFRLNAMSYFGCAHPLYEPSHLDIISLMKG